MLLFRPWVFVKTGTGVLVVASVFVHRSEQGGAPQSNGRRIWAAGLLGCDRDNDPSSSGSVASG